MNIKDFNEIGEKIASSINNIIIKNETPPDKKKIDKFIKEEGNNNFITYEQNYNINSDHTVIPLVSVTHFDEKDDQTEEHILFKYKKKLHMFVFPRKNKETMSSILKYLYNIGGKYNLSKKEMEDYGTKLYLDIFGYDINDKNRDYIKKFIELANIEGEINL
jgi:hypothetical protein